MRQALIEWACVGALFALVALSAGLFHPVEMIASLIQGRFQ